MFLGHSLGADLSGRAGGTEVGGRAPSEKLMAVSSEYEMK